MRPASTFNTTTPPKASLSPPGIAEPRSSWHSPVPYLFGGLAAMLGLIAFALLILACSYWKLSRWLDNDQGGDQQRDLEIGNENDASPGKSGKAYEEKILVIMAGDKKPTFLATPVSSRASTFGDKNSQIDNKEKEKVENGDDQKRKLIPMITSAADETREARETQQAHE